MDFRTCTKADIEKELDKMIASKTNDDIHISHVVSNDFLDMFGIDENDIEDFNGWSCDWWVEINYNGARIGVSGNAFYGTIALTKDVE